MVLQRLHRSIGLKPPSTISVLGAFLAGTLTVAFGPDFLILAALIAGSMTLLVFGGRAVIRRRSGRAIAAFCCASVLIWMLVLSPGAALSLRRLSPGGFALVEAGMSLSDVERLMGGPAGNYGANSARDGAMSTEGTCISDLRRTHATFYRLWTNDWQRFEVCFDAEGRVTNAHQRAKYQQRFTVRGRLLRLLGAF